MPKFCCSLKHIPHQFQIKVILFIFWSPASAQHKRPLHPLIKLQRTQTCSFWVWTNKHRPTSIQNSVRLKLIEYFKGKSRRIELIIQRLFNEYQGLSRFFWNSMKIYPLNWRRTSQFIARNCAIYWTLIFLTCREDNHNVISYINSNVLHYIRKWIN